MANLKDLIVYGTARIIGRVYSSEFVGNLIGNAKTATTANKTAYSLSVRDGASTPVAAIDSWNGSSSKTLTVKGDSPITTTATTSTGTITVTHDKKGPNTSKGDTSNQTPGFGDTFKVTSATVDVYGHTTELADHTVTIPSNVVTKDVNGLMSSDDKAKLDGILDLVYPVGSIYMSVNSTSPAELFGGTWESLKDRFLIGAGNSYAVNATGGASSHAHTTGGHTLTTNEIPKHTHGGAGKHSHSKGGMQIQGHLYLAKAGHWGNSGSASGAFSITQGGDGNAASTRSNQGFQASFNAANNWWGNTSEEGNHTHSSVGGDGSHSHGNTGSSSNIPPYLAVYMWKRTA